MPLNSHDLQPAPEDDIHRIDPSDPYRHLLALEEEDEITSAPHDPGLGPDPEPTTPDPAD